MEYNHTYCKTNCSFFDVCYGKIAYCPKRIIDKHTGELTEKEQLIVNMKCGFNGEKQHSFAEIGRMLNLSGARISQIYKEATCNRYLSYLGATEEIVICGRNNENYAFYYSSVFDRDSTNKNTSHNINTYKHIKIADTTIPYLTVSQSDKNKLKKDLSISIDE